ncbi:hypothetical protein [Acinetobacter nosocomialis]|uniref:hypothetical protein n=1 Tax=Acinetobacter nosocomialis TaxID=106654 RepID=UPI001B83E6A3|nr:hypothetical protein [Acinetobacter nosocomialis]MBR7715579.1 hypothetical protein [Acinetobacter nosocomialis]
MSEFKFGDKVCFLGGHSLPEFFGGVYEVIGQTIAGIFNDEYVLNDKGKNRRVSYKAIRHATPEEIAAGHRIDNDMGDDFPIENRISPNCQSRDV